MRQKLIALQGEIDESTIITGDFNTPLSEMDRSSRKEMGEVNRTINQLNIIGIHGCLLYPTIAHCAVHHYLYSLHSGDEVSYLQ